MLHVLCGCGCRTSSGSVSVDNVEMVKSSVEGFNARNSDLGLKGKLEWRSKISLDLHRPLCLEVHPHCAVSLLWLCHLTNRRLFEIGRECAALSRCECKQLVEHACDECSNANFLEQFSVVCCLEEDAGRMESNWTGGC